MIGSIGAAGGPAILPTSTSPKTLAGPRLEARVSQQAVDANETFQRRDQEAHSTACACA